MNRQLSRLIQHRRTSGVLLTALAASLCFAGPASAWIDDQNVNKIDDRIEAVDANGIAAAFEDNDPSKRMKIGVFDGAVVEFAIYVGYDHHPTPVDEAALAAVVGPVAPMKTYLYIDYTRTQATYAEIEAIAGLPGVTRVEAIPMMYVLNHVGARVVRSREAAGLRSSENYSLFPNVRQHFSADGTGIVVGIIDTGVNDTPMVEGYPGHESVMGKFVGGGNFFSGDPLLNTGVNDSENPEDRGSFHGTHTAGTAIGTGGLDGFFAGVAPAARLVDCKALSDAGAGFGSADAIEWCIANRNNDWGLTGADTIYAGIDVLSLSLGCLDCSADGTSAGEQIVNVAVQDHNMVVCIATGNDDAINQIGSPAAADLSLAVGATNHFGSLDRADDTVADFSNEGPRANDGDADQIDEYKPELVAPGAGIISADGNFLTDGGGYVPSSGTSMSTPMVSGVAALIREAAPTLTALEIREIMKNSAIHGIPSDKGNRAPDPSGIDSNYNPMAGWGIVDAYAAIKEAQNSTSGVQVVRIQAVSRPLDSEIDVKWWTQREYPFLGFNVHRAPDVSGAPGTFAQINTVIIPGTGDAILVDDPNRTPYVFVDNDASLVVGQTYWYQVEWVDLTAGSHLEPPVPATFGQEALIATVFYAIQHNTPDNDLFARVGTSSSYDPDAPEFFVVGEGTFGQDSVVVHEPANTGTAVTGYQEHFWSVGLTAADGIGGLLPPSQDQPWFLHLVEGGFINRVGTMNAFSMFVNDSPGSASGTTYVTNSPTPMPTIDTFFVPGASTTLWIPEENLVPVAVASMEALSEDDAVRLRLELEYAIPGATAKVHRGRSSDLNEATVLTPSPLDVDGLHFEYVDRDLQIGVEYWYWLELRDADNLPIMSGPVAASTTSGTRTFAARPAPNPVSTDAVFAYRIGRDVASNGAVDVRLTLHDVRGRVVRTLKSGHEAAGSYRVVWDGNTDRGSRVASGVYYYRFQAGPMTRTSKVMVRR